MGGRDSGVEPDTTDIVLECAVFDPLLVRRTSRRLGVSSDSSYRYERGVDRHAAPEAAARAVDLIVATAGGRLAGRPHRAGGGPPWAREIVLQSGYVRERLGFDIPDADMRGSLESLELAVVREETVPGVGVAWTVAVPSWRDDLGRPIDLVEEILRLHGTDAIPPARVAAAAVPQDDDPVVRFNRAATEYLVGHDFNECVNLTLRSAPDTAAWVSQAAAQELSLENPFVDDQSHLRPTLVLGLLETLRLNRSRGVPACRLCETGRIFVEHNGQNLECAAAAFVMTADPERRWRTREAGDFYTAKHHVAALAAAAGIDLGGEPLLPVSGPSYGWQEGHSAGAGDLGQGWIARFGLVNLAMSRAHGVEGPVHGGILAVLPGRLQADAGRRTFSEFSPFPAALRDIALVVDESVPAGEVAATLRRAAAAATGGRFVLEDAAVFDVYRGKGLPDGKKSLAFSLVFRAGDRTLTDEEVNAAFARLQEELAKATSFAVRK
jgi:phenylalanyl-tRNA synthetase beta chain